jgi:hypothetical protein
VTTGERFTVIISLLGLVFVVMTALLGFVVKVTVRWTRTEDKLGALVTEVRKLIIRKDADHERIRSDVRDKEARADVEHRDMRERLTWLERRELAQRRENDP